MLGRRVGLLSGSQGRQYVGDPPTLPLPETERGMLCDPMQLKACEAMLGFCAGARSGPTPALARGASSSRSASCAAPWQTYDLPWSAYSIVPMDAMEEDPDNRPYIWDLEEEE